MSLGMIYDSQKKFDQAKEHYQKVLKINPKFAPAANNLAYLYADKGENLDEALTLAQTAKEQVPDNPNISDTLGWVYYRKGIYSRAVTYLQEAMEKSPRSAILHYHLGMAYFKNGEIDKGKKELKRSLELDAKFQGAEEAKATLQKIG
jgi:tetratricopeptide (TPR) repeat protein